MSSDGPGSSRSLFSYFQRSRSSSESAPSPSNDVSLPERDLSSSESENAVSEPEESPDGRVVLEPYQPRNVVFPPCKFGVQSRSFQAGWFDKWKWLDWDNKKDCVYCHPCCMAVRLNFTLLKKAESAFSESGFRNWKDTVRCFKKHEASHSHRDASLKWLHYTKSQSVASQLSNRVRSDQAMARNCLLKLITTLCFLAHQGLAFRGHNESQGNFMQLLQLRSQDCPELSMWIKRRDNWLSHEVQYELLEIMAHSVLDSVLTMLSLLMKPRT